MPALPEIARVGCQVGEAEVYTDIETEHPGGPPGDVRIAREVAVDLQREGVCSQKHRRPAGVVRPVDAIDQHGHIVGDHQLLEEPHERQLRPAVESLWSRVPRFEDLRHEVRAPLDRSGHQLGEEADVEHQVRQVGGGAHSPPVDVDRVAHGLECIEGDPEGQDNLPGRQVKLEPGFACQRDQ